MAMNLFVTGTDTNAGKTVLSALLTAALDGIYWKPVQSGASEGTDRRAVMQWAEIPEDRTLPECYSFDPPVSPHLAAREAGVTIDLRQIRPPISKAGQPVIAEGAGGVLAPLNDHETILDLIRHLSFPVVVASRTALGTINHTVLTVGALRNAGAQVLGVVMLGPENIENRRAVEWYGKVPVIGHVPMLQEICRKALLGVFETRFDKTYFCSGGHWPPVYTP
ncbi:MAG TPA: dethiobiotin synthase [Terriglobia bacterium]|nr:dethiobiotin synthase [Terriglobia bacterium]